MNYNYMLKYFKSFEDPIEELRCWEDYCRNYWFEREELPKEFRQEIS